MPTVRLHYEGWVSLPSALRRKLGLNSGDRLEADLVNGTIVLRPAAKASSPVPRDEQASGLPAADVPETLTPKAATPARRKPGRPRKGEAAAKLAPAAKPKQRRGRPKAALAPEPGLAPRPVVSNEPWKLRRKEDLHPKAVSADQPPPPSRPPYRASSEAGSPADERRPFRNVEVRKLGPGRRHSRPRGHSWSALASPGE
jgi:AbrB family looped-hinge helix DNA binding protein